MKEPRRKYYSGLELFFRLAGPWAQDLKTERHWEGAAFRVYSEAQGT